MSYAVAADLSSRIGSSVFAEIYGTGTSYPEAESDLASAAAEIDGAIAARYCLPVTGTGSLALLKDWNLTLAEERTFARPAGSAYSEKIRVRVDQVRKYLEMIRNDQFRLPDAAEITSGGVALVKNDPPVFGRDRMNGF